MFKASKVLKGLNNEEDEELAKKIIDKLPKNIMPIHISLVGSRAKGYSDAKSEYEVRLIVMDTKENYELNSIERSFGLNVEHLGIKVNCICADLKMVLERAEQGDT